MKEIENYKLEEKTVDLAWANIFAIIILIPTVIIFGLPYFFIWRNQFTVEYISDISDKVTSGYVIGAIIPTVILGFVPAIISIVIGSPGLLLFGIFFIIAAGGDILIINLLRKENNNSLAQDHPSAAGFFIYKQKDLNDAFQ